jgi:hypothetical protein
LNSLTIPLASIAMMQSSADSTIAWRSSAWSAAAAIVVRSPISVITAVASPSAISI